MDGIVENLQNALQTWDAKMAEIWQIIMLSPQEFRGGGIWRAITQIHGGLTAVGLALLVLFFVVGVIKNCGNFAEIKRPEHALKLFIRFILAKTVVTHGLELMMAIFSIAQGIVSKIVQTVQVGRAGKTMLPQSIIEAIESADFLQKFALWPVTLLGSLAVTVLSFLMILTVYGRFFKLFLYAAIAPVPLSTFAGEPTQNVGKNFIKSYAGVCLEGVIIVLACVIFSLFSAAPASIDASASAATQVWVYIGELCFNLLVLVGSVKTADKICHHMLGL